MNQIKIFYREERRDCREIALRGLEREINNFLIGEMVESLDNRERGKVKVSSMQVSVASLPDNMELYIAVLAYNFER
jgi:hypothetical protein